MSLEHNLNISSFDLFIIGGGINGVGIARDATQRGLSAGLCDKGDLGGATSSASSQLIHGGLRYLEYGEFRLVHKALKERERLLTIAPHLIKPLRFVMPHHPRMRPLWQLRTGLWLYDHLAQRKQLPASSVVDLRHTVYGETLKTSFQKACLFSDCWVDDARLVISTAKAARDGGAVILPRTSCLKAASENGRWQLTLQSKITQEIHTVFAKTLVNAAGPWVDEVQQTVIGLNTQYHIRLVKGSHIILPALYAGDHAYLLQAADKRVIFTIPIGDHHTHTIVGTTDLFYQGDLNKIQISEAEIDYLLVILKDYFKQDIQKSDIVHTYAGVRPLVLDPSKTLSQNTRDYTIELQTLREHPPLLTVLGGKITTYRCLAEDTLDMLQPYLPPCSSSKSAWQVLPGGHISQGDMSFFCEEITQSYPWLPTLLRQDYCYRYGSEIHVLLAGCQKMTDLGEAISEKLYEREIRYLQEHEWALTAEDILWRRTKLGLITTSEMRETLRRWLSNHPF
ncbi:MAG: glycerol-3-phosphate dehydrogenase [Gammaproteobacteria bacterium]|nr:glycerol-3-phosphate dehydrogenase [Gammaproteobacteria bacterium]